MGPAVDRLMAQQGFPDEEPISRRSQKPRLEPAPAPRRFAQGMATTFMAATGLSLASGWLPAACVFEFFLVVALSALIAGKFCLGAYIYHTLGRRNEFANPTCPWSK